MGLCTHRFAYSASIATIVRIPFAKGYLDNPDYLYTTVDLGIWGTVEVGVALTASSLATLKPLLKQLRLFKTLSSSERLSSDPDERPTNRMTPAGKITVINRVDVVSDFQGRGESRRDKWRRRGSMDVELVGRREDNSDRD